jgi:hypothetical protein
MRRLLFPSATIIGLLIATAVPASSVTYPQHAVSGSFTVTSFNLNFYTDPNCFDGILLDMGMAGDISPFGPSTIAVHTCDLRPSSGPYVSSFTLTAANGTLTGTVPTLQVTALPPPQGAEIKFFIDVSGGTGLYAGVTGSITTDVTLYLSPNATPPGTVTGTITGPPVPTTKSDCKAGSWQHVVDNNIQPFKNQGQCVSFVSHGN